MPAKLTHIDQYGRASMVDVTDKAETQRTAIARGEVHMAMTTLDHIKANQIDKGDVLTVAQIAGITGGKRAADLVPLCHPLPLTHIDVKLELDEAMPGIVITAAVKTTAKTGVEMEALTAVAVAALTAYDMVKAVDKTMRIGNIRLVEKRGGRSGGIFNE